MSRWKQMGLRIAVSPGVRAAFRPWTLGRVPILMAHRFTEEPDGSGSTSAELLDLCLAFLSRNGYRGVTLAELCDELRAGRVPSRTVCFTVDDGYRDFAEVAFPVLERHGFPATVFVASGFIGGVTRYWWDRIGYAFDHTSKEQVAVRLGADAELAYRWRDAAAAAARHDFTLRCKAVPEEAKNPRSAGSRRASRLRCLILPPPAYRAMSWEICGGCRPRGSSSVRTRSRIRSSRAFPTRPPRKNVRGSRRSNPAWGRGPAPSPIRTGSSRIHSAVGGSRARGTVERHGEPGIVSKATRSLREPIPSAAARDAFDRAGFVQMVGGVEGLIQAIRSRREL
jgi:hypothetical protein